MTNYHELSEHELQLLIKDAEKALKLKKEKKRKEVLARIQELAESIDVRVEIKESDKKNTRKGIKIPIKYRNPNNPDEKWTGRGLMPKWLRELIEQGHDKSEFEVG